MRKKIEWQWESIQDENNTQTYRAKVIGGWIVMTVVQEARLKLLSNSTIFIADRDHEWTIVAPMKEQIPAEKAGTNWENPKAS